MKLKCVSKVNKHDKSFTIGNVYDVVEETENSFGVIGDDEHDWYIYKDSLDFAGDSDVGVFEIVDEATETEEELCSQPCDKPMTPQRTMESLKIATLRSIQEQCVKANLSISIDPEGFNIFDCDTEMQTIVESVTDAIEILETKLEYKDSMGKWGWV